MLKCSCLGGKAFHKWYHGKIAAWTCLGKTLVLTSQTLPEQQVKVDVHHYGWWQSTLQYFDGCDPSG